MHALFRQAEFAKPIADSARQRWDFFAAIDGPTSVTVFEQNGHGIL